MLTPAPVQTNYTQYILPAQNGMLADEINWAADTRIVETAGGIGFGLAVSQGTLSDAGCIIGGSAFCGITRVDHTLALSGTLTIDSYPQNDNAGVLTMGDLWVIVSTAVVAGAAVSYNTSTGQLGTGTTIPQAKWMTSAAANGLAVVRLGNIAAPH